MSSLMTRLAAMVGGRERVGDPPRTSSLDRLSHHDFALEPRVACTVNVAHLALSERADHLEPAELHTG